MDRQLKPTVKPHRNSLFAQTITIDSVNDQLLDSPKPQLKQTTYNKLNQEDNSITALKNNITKLQDNITELQLKLSLVEDKIKSQPETKLQQSNS